MQQHQQPKEEAYSNFINSINSQVTKKEYGLKLNYFMQFCNVTNNHEDLLLVSINDLESRIRDYIVWLRHTRKLAPGTVTGYIAPIVHFYEMNGFTLHWKRLKKFMAKHYTVVEDKPYSHEQIKLLLDTASLRDKCMILVMCSAGLRRGALPYLRLRDLEKIAKYNLYKLSVYKREQEQYISYCTPECAKYIDQYLDWRQRLGEQLKPNSPLFRVEFDSITEVNRPKTITPIGIAFVITKLLDKTGLRTPGNDHTQRTELMQTHGFRKFFNTQCINHNMNPLYAEYLMGHKTGLMKSYFKPTDTELLEGNDQSNGYTAIIPYLTINATEEENQHLKQQLAKQEQEHSKEWELARQQIDQIRQKMGLL